MAMDPRSERLEARLTRDQKELFRRAAALRGGTITQFVLASATEAAERAIRAQTVISLDQAATTTFVDALLKAPVPADRLRTAARRYLSQGLGG